MRQLAGRLGISQQAVARIEKEESSGKVTVKTLRRIAEGLDCVFVYGFVPRTSLNETVTRQARRVALDRLARVSPTMNLERQGLSAAENEGLDFLYSFMLLPQWLAIEMGWDFAIAH